MKMPSLLEKHQQLESLQFLRMVLLKTVLISGIMVILLAGRLSAQVLYGGLVGNVTDRSGALVPNAEVRAQNLDTGAVLQTTTGNTGSFAIGNVPPGRFEVTITKEGFGTFKAPSVSVEMNAQVRVDAALQVGNTTDTITVSTQDAQLQTDSADVHDSIGSKQFQDLPQPTRTYQGLVGLVTGVAPPSPDFAGGGGTNNPGRSFAIEANGTSQSGTDVRIDGVSAVNPWVQFYSTAVPSTEAIESVSVVTSSPEAEQGLASGAQINVQLKSGTNRFHGSLYELHQDNALKARPYFQPKD